MILPHIEQSVTLRSESEREFTGVGHVRSTYIEVGILTNRNLNATPNY